VTMRSPSIAIACAHGADGSPVKIVPPWSTVRGGAA